MLTRYSDNIMTKKDFDFDSMFKGFDNLFSDLFPTEKRQINNIIYANTAIKQLKDKVNVTIIYPGVKKEDFKIQIKNKTLTVSCEGPPENKDGTYKYQSFKYSWKLDSKHNEDKIEASYKEGILTISVPFVEKVDDDKENVKNILIS